MEIDRNGLEVLDRDTCLRLLDGRTLGRIGVTVGALPVVLPVTFCRDGDRICVRTSPGTKLDAALRGTVVAFEVDDLDPLSHSGWSVLVRGVAREAVDPPGEDHLASLPLPRWAPAAGDHVVAISTEMVSGRRIVAGRPPAIDRALARERP